MARPDSLEPVCLCAWLMETDRDKGKDKDKDKVSLAPPIEEA
ncbi:hypothetical protein Vi05172_g7069 [Venturia inaequalis]|nr:hypothetical protein Vi05172_g7069 [Venturia inaequalis]